MLTTFIWSCVSSVYIQIGEPKTRFGLLLLHVRGGALAILDVHVFRLITFDITPSSIRVESLRLRGLLDMIELESSIWIGRM